MKKIIIGTRGSKLALKQADEVKQKIISTCGLEVDVKVIKTAGDIDLNTPIRNVLDKGFYTKEIENMLSETSIDLAVHSMKDLPVTLNQDFEIGAAMRRKSAADVLISNKYNNLADLPEKSIIAVGSLRRNFQLKMLLPSVKTVDIRGNIETRIKKLFDNNWDGLIMAKAAIERLSLKNKYYEFSPIEMVPAPCQGIVAVEFLKKRNELVPILDKINDDLTFRISKIERSISKLLEGGCKMPVGCFAQIKDNHVYILAYISNDLGNNYIIESVDGRMENIDDLKHELIFKMNNKGLKEILSQRNS